MALSYYQETRVMTCWLLNDPFILLRLCRISLSSGFFVSRLPITTEKEDVWTVLRVEVHVAQVDAPSDKQG